MIALKLTPNLDSVLSTKVNEGFKPVFSAVCEAECEMLKQRYNLIQRAQGWSLREIPGGSSSED
jgi:hypothetical protein